MIADWDEEQFKDNGVMNFYHMDRIKTKKEPFEVDYCGFGFTKISTKLIKKSFVNFPILSVNTPLL